VFRRDDVLTEGTHTNVFAVADAVITTHPEGPRILSGVTRGAVIEAAQAEGFVVREEPIPVAALERATEVFLTGTSAEVMPVSRVDGRTIGTGRPGPVAVRLRGAFRRLS
jgi:D-alanine transaminase